MTSAVLTETPKRGLEQNTPTISFLDLKAQFAGIRDEVMAAIAGVMESQSFIMGPDVKLLEEELAAMLGAKHAIACASGTDALILSLMAAGISPGDEVLTAPFSFIATAGSIAHVGAKPVFVDIDPVSYLDNQCDYEEDTRDHAGAFVWEPGKYGSDQRNRPRARASGH
jgi:dTDP-4-amino-4,6-dideoxygalactose transaminase